MLQEKLVEKMNQARSEYVKAFMEFVACAEGDANYENYEHTLTLIESPYSCLITASIPCLEEGAQTDQALAVKYTCNHPGLEEALTGRTEDENTLELIHVASTAFATLMLNMDKEDPNLTLTHRALKCEQLFQKALRDAVCQETGYVDEVK